MFRIFSTKYRGYILTPYQASKARELMCPKCDQEMIQTQKGEGYCLSCQTAFFWD